jgi:glycosyltransferase involved in cell wall biosynthesis
MQKTNFQIEALIHDDASTDDTADIIREYEKKYPEIIKPIYQTENQCSKSVNVSQYNFSRAQGKYIALCEGDDYWTDPYKLQKQVDFLEEHEDFSICFHPVKVFNQNESVLIDDYITRSVPDLTTIYDLASGNYIHTASVVFRKKQKVLDLLVEIKGPIGDYPLHMFNAQYGKIKKLPDIMSVYRIHDKGIWSLKPVETKALVSLDMLEGLIYIFRDDNKLIEQLNFQYENNTYELYSFYKRNNDILKAKEYFSKSYIFIENKIHELEKTIEELKNSKSYRTGRFLLTPFRVLKTLWVKFGKAILSHTGISNVC